MHTYAWCRTYILPGVVNRMFGNRTQSSDWVRLGSVIELNQTHKKVLVRLCLIAEPIELQLNDWIQLVFGSVLFSIDYAGSYEVILNATTQFRDLDLHCV